MCQRDRIRNEYIRWSLELEVAAIRDKMRDHWPDPHTGFLDPGDIGPPARLPSAVRASACPPPRLAGKPWALVTDSQYTPVCLCGPATGYYGVST